MSWSRRNFLAASTATVALNQWGNTPDNTWNSGDLVHLIPAANHEQFAIKCSFYRPKANLQLLIDGRPVPGRQTDTEGRYFSFFV